MASTQSPRDELLRAGFSSVTALRTDLENLQRRRERLLDQHLDVTMYGGGDFGNQAMDETQRSQMNRRISEATGLRAIDERIAELRRILGLLEAESG